VHVALLIVLFAIPDPTRGFGRDDDLDDLERIVMVRNNAHEDPKPEVMKPVDDQGSAGAQGAPAPDEAGKLGKETEPNKKAHIEMKKTQDQPQLAKPDVIEKARHAGVLDVLRNSQNTFASITGVGLASSGFDDRDVFGDLSIGPDGGATGTVGYAMWGNDVGGGGPPMGIVGVGRLGRIGNCDANCAAERYGTSRGIGLRPRGRAPGKPVIVGGAVLVGEYSKETIRRQIRQKLPQIQYCYEKQLVAKHDIEGVVSTAFTIDETGKVIAVNARGVDDEVASCVAQVIKSIQFPRPDRLVQVTSYPFTFRSPGASASR
jgi:hypothetical protein